MHQRQPFHIKSEDFVPESEHKTIDEIVNKRKNTYESSQKSNGPNTEGGSSGITKIVLHLKNL